MIVLWTATIGPVLLALVGVAGHLIGRKRNQADAANLITSAAVALLEPYQETIEALRIDIEQNTEELAALRSQIGSLETHVQSLSQQVRDLGHEPVSPHTHY